MNEFNFDRYLFSDVKYICDIMEAKTKAPGNARKPKTPFTIPKYMWERIDKIEEWGDQTDEPKYMIFFADGWLYAGEFDCWGVDTKTEALDCIRRAEKEK